MTLSTNRDRVRLLIGDTDSDDPLLYDDEIDYLLDARQFTFEDETVYNVQAAAADAAAAIVAKYSRSFSFAEDGQRFELAQRVGHYTQLEQTLRSRAGGVSLAGTATTS